MNVPQLGKPQQGTVLLDSWNTWNVAGMVFSLFLDNTLKQLIMHILLGFTDAINCVEQQAGTNNGFPAGIY